jgi:predicted AlkP superfamily pyrophosphatase or phosphodiesterase
MRRFLCFTFTLIAFAFLTPGGVDIHALEAADTPAFSEAVPRASTPLGIILFSWDGLDRKVLKELLAARRLPFLAAVIEEGSYQDIDVRGHATSTKPGHAEMLTGLAADVTGVWSNSRYRPVPEGYTVFERLKQEFGKEGITTLFVAGKSANLGGRGPGEYTARKKKTGKKGGAANKPAKMGPGEPFYFTKRHLDVFDIGGRPAGKVGPRVMDYLEAHGRGRFFAFFHFSDPDHMGHRHGSGSTEYRQAGVTCDEWLGRVIQWLRLNDLYDRTLIYVTTDHGFDDNAKSHSNAPDCWLATNDPQVKTGGTIGDIASTILMQFGLPVARLIPPLSGRSLLEAAPLSSLH